MVETYELEGDKIKITRPQPARIEKYTLNELASLKVSAQARLDLIKARETKLKQLLGV